MKFKTVVELGGKTATGFQVPPEVVERLGASKKPAVSVTIGKHTYRSTVAVMGGLFYLPLSAENRTAAGVAAGDSITVNVELDTAPRTVEVPADFAKALKAAPAARTFYDTLSPSLKGYHVGQVEGTKTPETRQRRIEKAVALFLEGKQR